MTFLLLLYSRPPPSRSKRPFCPNVKDRATRATLTIMKRKHYEYRAPRSAPKSLSTFSDATLGGHFSASDCVRKNVLALLSPPLLSWFSFTFGYRETHRLKYKPRLTRIHHSSHQPSHQNLDSFQPLSLSLLLILTVVGCCVPNVCMCVCVSVCATGNE